MNESMQMECGRVLEMLPQFVDGDLAPDQSEWLDAHLAGCAKCEAALSQLIEIDGQVSAWGQSVVRRSPPPPGAREHLDATLRSLPAPRERIRWMPAAIAAIAAALLLATIAPQRKPPAVSHTQGDFVAIPYLPPLDPHENTIVVRMNVRVAALIAAGYRVAADPNTTFPADVLVGEDGRAHAIRVVSEIDSNKKGD